MGQSDLLTTISVHDRSPSVTIETNSYHFCKLSLVKKPYACTTQVQRLNHDCEIEAREFKHGKVLDDTRKNAQGSLIDHSSNFEGLPR